MYYSDIHRFHARLNGELHYISISGPDVNAILWYNYCKNMNFGTLIPTDYRDLINYPILPFKK